MDPLLIARSNLIHQNTNSVESLLHLFWLRQISYAGPLTCLYNYTSSSYSYHLIADILIGRQQMIVIKK